MSQGVRVHDLLGETGVPIDHGCNAGSWGAHHWGSTRLNAPAYPSSSGEYNSLGRHSRDWSSEGPGRSFCYCGLYAAHHGRSYEPRRHTGGTVASNFYLSASDSSPNAPPSCSREHLESASRTALGPRPF